MRTVLITILSLLATKLSVSTMQFSTHDAQRFAEVIAFFAFYGVGSSITDIVLSAIYIIKTEILGAPK